MFILRCVVGARGCLLDELSDLCLLSFGLFLFLALWVFGVHCLICLICVSCRSVWSLYVVACCNFF